MEQLDQLELCQKLIDIYSSEMFSNESMMGMVNDSVSHMSEEQLAEYKQKRDILNQLISKREDIIGEALSALDITPNENN